ncbi:Phosphate-induced protein 1 conserved region, partial [Musa troglodytarum]
PPPPSHSSSCCITFSSWRQNQSSNGRFAGGKDEIGAGSRLRRAAVVVQALRRVVRPRAPALPHGPRPLLPHQPLPHLVRPLARRPPGHTPRLLALALRPLPPPPSAAQWWSTVALYSDQTGANVSRRVSVAAEAHLRGLPRGASLTRLGVQLVIADALASGSLPVDHGRGAYLVLTAPGVAVQDFCRAACGFHYFTFPSLVGHTLPYAWVGHSGVQCPDVCAYPFAVPTYMTGVGAMRPPNGDVGVDGMVSVLAHELAELSTNPLVNAWYAGEDPTAPTEIADLCEGVYGTGGGGGYTGQVSKDELGRSYNLNGRNGRKFLVQWVWSPIVKACRGPNAMD